MLSTVSRYLGSVISVYLLSSHFSQALYIVNSSAQFISALLFGDRRCRVIDGARTGGKGKTV